MVVDVFSRRILASPDLAMRVGNACRESRELARISFYCIKLPVYRVFERSRVHPKRLRAKIHRAFTRSADKFDYLEHAGRISEEKRLSYNPFYGLDSPIRYRSYGMIYLNPMWDTFVWGPQLQRTKAEREMEKKTRKAKQKNRTSGPGTGTGEGASSSFESIVSAGIVDEHNGDPAYFRYATKEIVEGEVEQIFLEKAPKESIVGIVNMARSARHPDLKLAGSLLGSSFKRSLSAMTASGDPTPRFPLSSTQSVRTYAEPDRSPMTDLFGGSRLAAAARFETLTAQYPKREPREVRAARHLFGDRRVRDCFRLDLAKGVGTSNAEVLRVMFGGNEHRPGGHDAHRQGRGGNVAALARQRRPLPECIARLGHFCTVPGAKAVGHGWAFEPPVDGRFSRASPDLDS